MTSIKTMLTGFVIFICTGYALCGEGHFQPAKGKTIEQTLAEAKTEHDKVVSQMRAQLPHLKKQLIEEKEINARQSIISSLGRTEDAQAVDPIIEVLQNEKEDSSVRGLSVESLYNLYRPGLSSNVSIDAKSKQRIMGAIKGFYLKQNGTLKCTAAYNLYLMGEKKFVRLGVSDCLKSGYWEQLNSFVYVRKVDGVMIQVSLPGEDSPIKIDEDAHDILKEASGEGYTEEVRVNAAEMLVDLGDNDAALKASQELINNGKDYHSRAEALKLMCKIGTPEAKTVLENARNIPRLKRFANQLLKQVWGK